MLRNGIGTGEHARVFPEGTDISRNALGVKPILAAQLLRAKNSAKNHAVAEGQRLCQNEE